jgi:hypothetical protein
VSRLACKK